MAAAQTIRSMFALGTVVTVSAALPFCLTACAPAANLGAQATELQASADSDVLDLPTVTVYDVADTEITSPLVGTLGTSALGDAIESQITTSGFLIITDGVITEAEFGARFASLSEARFVLTEPTVLRRQGGEDLTVSVTGTLTVDDVAHPDTSLRLTPSVIGEDAAEFDVEFRVPDNPLIVGTDLPVEEISARIVLDAR